MNQPKTERKNESIRGKPKSRFRPVVLSGVALIVLAMLFSSTLPSPPTELLGTEAQSFPLAMTNGQTLDLAKHRGAEIVVLDFWATWCSPCRASMPILDRIVREEYAGRGVALYFVNESDPPEEAAEFAAALELHAPVALDLRADMAKAYKVNALPMTVFVGTDGIIRNIRQGTSAAIETEFRQDLDELLGG